jgi:hypothetical protein
MDGISLTVNNPADIADVYFWSLMFVIVMVLALLILSPDKNKNK